MVPVIHYNDELIDSLTEKVELNIKVAVVVVAVVVLVDAVWLVVRNGM